MLSIRWSVVVWCSTVSRWQGVDCPELPTHSERNHLALVPPYIDRDEAYVVMASVPCGQT